MCHLTQFSRIRLHQAVEKSESMCSIVDAFSFRRRGESALRQSLKSHWRQHFLKCGRKCKIGEVLKILLVVELNEGWGSEDHSPLEKSEGTWSALRALQCSRRRLLRESLRKMCRASRLVLPRLTFGQEEMSELVLQYAAWGRQSFSKLRWTHFYCRLWSLLSAGTAQTDEQILSAGM